MRLNLTGRNLTGETARADVNLAQADAGGQILRETGAKFEAKFRLDLDLRACDLNGGKRNSVSENLRGGAVNLAQNLSSNLDKNSPSNLAGEGDANGILGGRDDSQEGVSSAQNSVKNGSRNSLQDGAKNDISNDMKNDSQNSVQSGAQESVKNSVSDDTLSCAPKDTMKGVSNSSQADIKNGPIVICGGGTGGHLAVAKALNEELVLRGIRTIFIGSSGGQDKMWFENDAAFSEKFFLPSSGVVDKKGLGKLASLFNILNLALKCRKIFKTRGVKAVVSVGGYSAAPAAFAAIISGMPLFIHEQNAVIGNLNKLLRPLAKGFFSSYFKPVFSYPVAERFFRTARKRGELKTVIFLGGSQGAAAINSLALKLAPALKQKGVKIIHQCGKNALDSLREEYEKLGVGEGLDLFDFDPKIELKMHRADLAVSRAGAGTLWELTANALPSVFVPYPYAANNHQVFNAKFLVEQNLAKFCFQKNGEIDAEEMLNLINEMNLEQISSKLAERIDGGGASKIVDEILKNIETK